MSTISSAIHQKCLTFSDRVIKLNDYLLAESCKKEDERCKKDGGERIPFQLLAVANLSNQLLRAGTSIGANKAAGRKAAQQHLKLLNF